jgi:hypothetical protein
MPSDVWMVQAEISKHLRAWPRPVENQRDRRRRLLDQGVEQESLAVSPSAETT